MTMRKEGCLQALDADGSGYLHGSPVSPRHLTAELLHTSAAPSSWAAQGAAATAAPRSWYATQEQTMDSPVPTLHQAGMGKAQLSHTSHNRSRCVRLRAAAHPARAASATTAVPHSSLQAWHN
jgi:hypothetical protein